MEFLTKLKPLTSQTKEWPLARRRSKPHTVCWESCRDVKARSSKQGSNLQQTYLEGYADFSGHKFLHWCQHDGIPDLFTLTVPLHLSVQRRRLPGLGVGVVWTNSVDLKGPEMTDSSALVELDTEAWTIPSRRCHLWAWTPRKCKSRSFGHSFQESRRCCDCQSNGNTNIRRWERRLVTWLLPLCLPSWRVSDCPHQQRWGSRCRRCGPQHKRVFLQRV